MQQRDRREVASRCMSSGKWCRSCGRPDLRPPSNDLTLPPLPNPGVRGQALGGSPLSADDGLCFMESPRFSGRPGVRTEVPGQRGAESSRA